MIRRPFLALAPLAVLAVLVAGCGGGSKSSSPSGSSTSLGNGVVAIVGNEKITLADFNEVLARAKRQYKVQKKPFPRAGSPDYQTVQQQIVRFLVQRSA